MNDSDSNALNPTQSSVSPAPRTMAAAATVAPTTRFTRFTGATPISTITPPINAYHELVFIFTTATAGHLAAGGNIHAAYTSIADRPVLLCYDPRTALYYVQSVA